MLKKIQKIPVPANRLSAPLKKAAAILLVAALAIGAVAGGLFAYKGLTKKPVNVYAVTDFCMTDYWGDESETSGMVSTEGMQKVMVSDTQKVTKIYVTEGQTVKKGDKLLAYDTTLTTIDIKRAQIAVSKKELEIETAEKELSKIKTMQVSFADPSGTETADAVVLLADAGNILVDTGVGTVSEQAKKLTLLSGSGTKSDPYIYVMPEGYALSQESLRLMYNGEGKITIDDPGEDTGDSEVTEDSETTGDDTTGGSAGDDTGDNSGSTGSETGQESIGDGGENSTDGSGTTGSGENTTDDGAAEESGSMESGGAEALNTGAGLMTHTVNTSEITGKIVYVRLQTRENDLLSGSVVSEWGLKLAQADDEIVMGFYTPEASEDNGDDNGGSDYYGGDDYYYGGDDSGGSGYTAAEIAKMRNEKEQQIRDLKIELELAKIELQKKQDEFNNGVVVSQVDGTVRIVRDADEAFLNSEAVVEVSGGGGYYIEGTMSELELDTVSVGQSVTVSSWETGTSCEGTITEISDVPSTDNSGWTNGNTNVSYYPFTVFVSEDADLTEFDYVEITYTASAEENADAWYLEKEFVRTDNGRSYVYVLGEDGKLQQRSVSTGQDLWGYYIQIKDGLSMDDYVAFPYGDAADGAKAVIADSSEFYEN